jgi:choline monooxygenase
MPEFEGVEGFPSTSDDLAGFPLRRWKGLLFAGTEPRRFENCMDELGSRLGWMPIESFEHDPSRHRSYDIDANWALYVDNYLEGFHIPYVHGDLHEELDYDSYRTELFEGGVLQVGIARRGETCFELPESSPDHGQRIAAYYYWLYPGVMLNFYPWGLSVNLVIPLSVDRTRIVYHGFVWDRSKLGEGAGGDLDKVEAEDQGIVEAVQRGVAAGAYDRGRYSPTKEAGVHHFHRMLAS